jgi:hypothetical protein
MNECGGRILRQVDDADFHQRASFSSGCPSGALGLLVNHALNGFDSVGSRVLKRPANDALLADGELQKHRRVSAGRFAVLGESKHSERQPILRSRLYFGDARSDGLGLFDVLGLGAYRLIAVINRAVIVVDVVAIVVIERFRPAGVDPARKAIPCGGGPIAETWIVGPIEAVASPPTIAVPVAVIAPVVLPVIANVANRILTPVVPLAPVENLARQVLNVVQWSSRPAQIRASWLTKIWPTRLA